MNSKGLIGISVMVGIALLALGYQISGGHRADGMMSSTIGSMKGDTNMTYTVL